MSTIGEYAPLEVHSHDLFNQLLQERRPALAFDFGANDGGYTDMLSQTCNHVHAYEPVPDVFEVMRKRHAGNQKITVHRQAVGDIEKTVSNVRVFGAWTLLPNGSKPYQVGVNPEHAERPPFTMEVTTLDVEAVKYGAPDFIKLDVDGYELRVLKGGMETLIKKPCPIYYEYSFMPSHFGDDIRFLMKLIYSELGYRMWSMDGKFCATTFEQAFRYYPASSSYDVMLIHRDQR